MSIRYRMIDATAVPKIPSAATTQRLGARQLVRDLEEGERQQDDGAPDDRGRGGHEWRGRREAALREEVRAGVRERRDDDRECARDRPPTALRMEPGEHPDPGEAEQDADEPHPGDTLAREISDRQDGHEDGHGRVCDRRDPGVDVFLAPRDQRERDRAVDHPEYDAAPTRRSKRSDRLEATHPRDEEREQDDAREQQSQLDHRDRLDLVHRDLDEEIGRAPERRQREQERQVGARHGARLPSGRGLA